MYVIEAIDILQGQGITEKRPFSFEQYLSIGLFMQYFSASCIMSSGNFAMMTITKDEDFFYINLHQYCLKETYFFRTTFHLSLLTAPLKAAPFIF